MREVLLILQERAKLCVLFLFLLLKQLLEMYLADVEALGLLFYHLTTVHHSLVGVQVVSFVNHVVLELIPKCRGRSKHLPFHLCRFLPLDVRLDFLKALSNEFIEGLFSFSSSLFFSLLEVIGNL